MLTKQVLIGAATITLLTATSGYAQSHHWHYRVRYHHASTASESFARGRAAMMRAMGAANLMNSMAARNYEKARARHIDNRLKAAKTYFEMKRTNRAYRAEEQRPRASASKLARLARQASGQPLRASDVHPVSGKLQWPTVLTGAEYRDYRETIDGLFAGGTAGVNRLSDEELQQLARVAGDLRIELQRRVKDCSPQQWIQANAFVKRLQQECRQAG